MRKPALALLAFSVSMAAAMVLAALVIRFAVERADRAWTDEIYEGLGEADPVSPGDISALQEEARRITGESGR
jgi:hypothetical protein